MLSWSDLSFEDKEGKVIVTLYKYFYREFTKEEFEELGEYEIKRKVGIIKAMSSGEQFEAPLDTIHKHFDIEKSTNDR